MNVNIRGRELREIMSLPAVSTEPGAYLVARNVTMRKGCVSVLVPIYNEVDHVDDVAVAASFCFDFVVDVNIAAPIILGLQEGILQLECVEEERALINRDRAIIDHFAFTFCPFD